MQALWSLCALGGETCSLVRAEGSQLLRLCFGSISLKKKKKHSYSLGIFVNFCIRHKSIYYLVRLRLKIFPQIPQIECTDNSNDNYSGRVSGMLICVFFETWCVRIGSCWQFWNSGQWLTRARL